VTRDEVTAFREVFHIPASEERAAARVFNMAREDVAGFEDYAGRIAAMFRSDDKPCGQDSVLCDLMEGLFHIAAADGTYHPGEDAFLERVAEIFGLEKAMFERMRARHTPGGPPDPYAVLGVDPGADLETVSAAWRAEARATHPDRMLARGIPEEAVKLAEARLPPSTPPGTRSATGAARPEPDADRNIQRRMVPRAVRHGRARLPDEGRSGREGVSRARQIEALVTVFRAIDADAIMVVEAPDISRRHDGETALAEFRAPRRASAPVRFCLVSPTRRSRT
jgi:DnaJ-domain-containing protein 1